MKLMTQTIFPITLIDVVSLIKIIIISPNVLHIIYSPVNGFLQMMGNKGLTKGIPGKGERKQTCKTRILGIKPIIYSISPPNSTSSLLNPLFHSLFLSHDSLNTLQS